MNWLRFYSGMRLKRNTNLMSPNSILSLALYTILTFSVFSCFSDSEDPNNLRVDTALPFDCNQFSYADTIYYISATQNVIVSPEVTIQGNFEASPAGLSINSSTGVIDVNASETGLKYKVSFTPTGSSQTCETFVTVGGVNYLDGVYVLGQNQLLADPVYNGVVGLPLPCPDDDDDDDDDEEDGDDDDDDSCDFDTDNPTGQLLADLGFEVSNKGIFDLQKTVDNGTFGSTPVNGAILNVELFYRLSDPSAKALNSLPLRFFYYETVADIPQVLLDDIDEKSALINELRSKNSFNFRLSNETRPRKAPRPPFIVIVARLQ